MTKTPPPGPNVPEQGSSAANPAGQTSPEPSVAQAGSTWTQRAPADGGSRNQSSAHVTALEEKLRTARILNVVLAAVAVFLGVVVLGQSSLGGSASDAGGAGTNTAAAPADQIAAEPEPDQAPGTQADAPQSGPESHLRRDPDDPMAVGKIGAPVVMVEWFDYRCPYCGVFARETLPQLMQQYVDEGLLRIEFNDVVFFGDNSLEAAVAGRAAAEQGKFMEYMEVLFNSVADETGHPDFSRQDLVSLAEQAGVADIAKFEADLDSPELKAAVEESTARAQGWGVNSVPFFVVDDQAFAGAQPLDAFQELIDGQLAQQ